MLTILIAVFGTPLLMLLLFILFVAFMSQLTEKQEIKPIEEDYDENSYS